MGIVETTLSEFDLSELAPCKIEQDTSGIIHLHLGSFRIEVTPEEFEDIVHVVEEGRGELRTIKNGEPVDNTPPHVDDTATDHAEDGPRTTTLSAAQQQTLRETFVALDAHDIPYAVLRSYDELPEALVGSDVDILVDAARYDDAVAVCQARFEPSVPRIDNLLYIAGIAARKPLLTLRTLVTSPSDVASFIKRRLFASNFGSRDYIARSFSQENLSVELVNHLAYASPLDGSMIRTAASVEQGMLARRLDHGVFYGPAPADELTHLIARGVYDHNGVFPERYVARCDHLRELVYSDSQSAVTFETLLADLFYGAAPLVSALVAAGEYNCIWPRLVSHDGY
ncbi:hypothetical protein [Haladaptatus sp. DYSN1]|uniref:hypothetical protein n=1 Tax=unclassified Haladaptatus TaxID=2622732 RepID=UPI0024053215|nr:hypothetical protein [Haladaptatus sp. DYSN1]